MIKTEECLYLTESEAWEALADCMEGLGTLPPLNLNEYHIEGDAPTADGLCWAIQMMKDDNAITSITLESMYNRIWACKIAHRCYAQNRAFIYKPHSVPPRVKLARKFAKESA